MTVRLIASDIDGTLLRSDGTMSDRTLAAVAAAEAAGILVVLCTGRPHRWMKDLSDQTGHRGLAVCANGAVVYDLHTETVVETFELEAELAMRLTSALRGALPDVVFAVEREAGMTHEAVYVPRFPLPSHVVVDDLDALLDAPVLKLLVKHPEMTSAELHAAAHDAVDDLADIVTATYASGTMLEVSAAGISKAFALERVAAERGITAADAVAFGDMPNDIPMLSWAGRGIAVGNAHPDVIAIADDVTTSNDEDGVAVVVERLLS